MSRQTDRGSARQHRGWSKSFFGVQLGRAQLHLDRDVARAAVHRIDVAVPLAARVRAPLEELQVVAVRLLQRLQLAVLRAHVGPRGRVGLGRQPPARRVACVAQHAEAVVGVVEVLAHPQGEPALLAQVLRQRRPARQAHPAALAADADRLDAVVVARRARAPVHGAEERARPVAQLPARTTGRGEAVGAALRTATRGARLEAHERDAVAMARARQRSAAQQHARCGAGTLGLPDVVEEVPRLRRIGAPAGREGHAAW